MTIYTYTKSKENGKHLKRFKSSAKEGVILCQKYVSL